MLKRSSFLLIAIAALGNGTASAGDDSPHSFSANVALTTDYRFRGISQTSEDPAVQGGFDYSYAPYGFYAGVWASSLDFNVPDPDPADVEIDYYGGFTGELTSGVSWDIGGLYYSYPGSDTGPGAADYDYVEVYGSLGYDFGSFSATVGLNFSPDYFFESGDYYYTYGDVEVPLPNDFAIAGHLGRNEIDDNAQFGTPDYTDWKIGVSKSIGAFTFDLSYVDTDLSDGECFGGSSFCDATAIFTISSSW
ncbi:MAG: hypothetical protein IT495_18615 [Gammaproteobacteria bacterium]|nr:hypothetical protein [Gammaproteobacteria bacterium]